MNVLGLHQQAVDAAMARLPGPYDGNTQNWRGSDWGRSEARPPWDNAWARTMEEVIDNERASLPLAFPRRRVRGVNKYFVLPKERQATPKSTYQEQCYDLSPRLRPKLREELTPAVRPTRPMTARPDLMHGPPDDKIDSTYRQSYAYQPHQILSPRRPESARPSAKESTPRSRLQADMQNSRTPKFHLYNGAAGVMTPRDPPHLVDPMCMDENVQWQRKIKIMRAQVSSTSQLKQRVGPTPSADCSPPCLARHATRSARALTRV